MTPRRPAGPRRGRAPKDTGPVLTALALGAGLWACVAANHPVPGFDRLHERAGGLGVWLPRWRFFAPEPVSSDLVLRYRLDDDVWADLSVPRAHGVSALLIAPGRRRRKALSQVGRTVARMATERGRDAAGEHWQHRLLVGFLLAELRRRGVDGGATTVRFSLIEDPGHDRAGRARVLYESGEVPIAGAPSTAAGPDGSRSRGCAPT
ncbi:hypothetical protein DMP17_44420 [Pseudonocardia sp. TMWB2A]|uniref:hypothetical protein n=1 Tax=Pseudonocardia sp. TMWB2A TaxID=687430 RepID=UPI00307DDCBF